MIERRQRKRRDGSAYVVWRVRWSDTTGAERSRTFDRAADARAFEAKVRTLERADDLAELDAGKETLADADWLRAVREAASEDGYGLVINARVDVFLGPFLAGAGAGTQEELVPEALRRATAYLEAGADCIYPIALWETEALRSFMSEIRGPVNVIRGAESPSLAELAALGVARVSWGPYLYREAMARFDDQLASLQE